MAATAAEILAAALEQDADAQERGGELDLAAHMASVRRQVLPINNIPRPVFRLALRFWREWDHAHRSGWRYYGPMTEQDWPAAARLIASHVRTGRLPQDRAILDSFVRRRLALPWRDLKQLLGSAE